MLDTISNVTHTASFTRDEVVHALLLELVDFQPTEIRIQDKRATPGDHPDHVYGALFGYEAAGYYPQDHVVTGYRDYDTENEPANLSDADVRAKSHAFFLYAEHDVEACHSQQSCAGSRYDIWLRRQYRYDLEDTGAMHS